MQLNADTPVEDILGKPGDKPKLAKLAQAVFDRFDMASFRGFTQFRSADDLAAVIEAKRKNVFDYGVCFQETDSGLKYPKNTNAVMTALRKAMDSKYDEIDFRAIGLVDIDGNPTVSLTDLCPSAPAESKAPAKKKAAPAPKEKEPEPEETGPSEAELAELKKEREAKAEADRKPEPRRTQPKRQREEEPASEEPQQAVLIGSSEVLERIDKLAVDLADALTTVVEENRKAAHAKNDMLEDEIQYVKNELENVKAGIIGLANFLNVVSRNMQAIGAYLDPYLEYEELDDPTLDLLKLSMPEDVEERLAGEPTIKEVIAENRERELDAAQEPAPAEPEPEPEEEPQADEQELPPEPDPDPEPEEDDSDDDGEVSIEYTRNELVAMSIEDLREIAEKVGVANASKIPYKTSLVNRICQLADID